MKIVFFSHYFPPEGNAPASRTYEHCARWTREGTDVTVITCAPNVPDGQVYAGYRNRFWPRRDEVDGIDVVRVWSWVRPNPSKTDLVLNYVTYMISAVFAFLFFVRRPNVIVATSPQFFCGWAGVFASWLKWRPLVLEVRDIWPESIITVGAMRPGFLTRMLEVLEKWMYRSASHIVAVGDGYRDNILSKVSVKDRISVVTNGVDPDKFSPAEKTDPFQKKWNLQGRFVCSYIGTVGLAHGLDVVIRTAKRLKDDERQDIVFLIVGGGARRAELQRLAEQEGVADLLIFTGRLDRSEIPDALANSDCCLVHLSKEELFSTVIPSKIFETMAMCRPIVMGVKGQAREIVMAAGAGTPMEPDDDQELLEILVQMADDPEATAEQGNAGRGFVIQNFNRNDLAQDYLDLLTAVAAGQHARLTNRTWSQVEPAPVNNDPVSSYSDAGPAL